MFFTKYDLRRPFSKHPDGRFINLAIQEHRDYVVERDRYLNNALEQGLDLGEVTVSVIARVAFNCLKCGKDLEVEHVASLERHEKNGLKIPSCYCLRCKISYDYNPLTQAFILSQR